MADDKASLAVEPVTVLYAIRYGLGRATGAHWDALELIRAHWDALAEWADNIRDDLARVERTTLLPDVRESTRALREWVRTREHG